MQCSKTVSSFDHLVGGGEHSGRDFEPKLFSGLEVDHGLVFGRRLHGQVSRLLALEDAINVPSRTPMLINRISTIRDQATGADEVALVVDRGKVVPGSK